MTDDIVIKQLQRHCCKKISHGIFLKMTTEILTVFLSLSHSHILRKTPSISLAPSRSPPTTVHGAGAGAAGGPCEVSVVLSRQTPLSRRCLPHRGPTALPVPVPSPTLLRSRLSSALWPSRTVRQTSQPTERRAVALHMASFLLFLFFSFRN